MPASSDYEFLSQYFGQPKKLGPGSADIAKYILLNAKRGKPVGPGGLRDSKPSVVGRLFDILSRGNYASAEFFREWAETGTPDSEAFMAGLSGRKKTTFKDTLKQIGVEDKALRATLGLGLDIFADPTTYIPFAGIVSKAKNLRKGSQAVTAEAPLGQRLLEKGVPEHPESFGLADRMAQGQIPTALRATEPSWLSTSRLPISSVRSESSFTTPRPALPGMPNRISIPESIKRKLDSPVDPAPSKAKEITGQLAIKFPDFKVSQIRKQAVSPVNAEKLIDDIQKGDPTGAAINAISPKLFNIKIEPRHQKLADEILSSWDNSRSTATLNKKFPDTVNAKQQVKLYYRALEAAKKGFTKPNSPANASRVRSTAAKIYLAMERSLESSGLILRIGTGENVRLSDVLNQINDPAQITKVLDEFGSTIKSDSPVGQIVESLRARGAIDDTKTVKLITEKIAESKAAITASGTLSDLDTKNFDQFLKQFSKFVGKASTISPAGANATNRLIDDMLKSSKPPAQYAIESSNKLTNDILSTGKNHAQLNTVLTRGLEKDLGKLPSWSINDNKATEWFMGRVATWWGQKDLRPMSLNAIGSSAATAATRGKVLDNLFNGFNQSERHEAFRVAQDLSSAATTAEVQKLSDQIKKLMDNLVGQISGTSVLTRAAVDFNELNKWMKRYKVGFEFTKGKVATSTGQTIDYSKGTDWVNSWKTADIKEDPKAFVFKIQQAMEQATREKALFEEIGERFGSKVPDKGFRTKVEGHPYIEGYYFTDDIASQIPRVLRDWNLPSPHYANNLIQLYDRVLSMWKSGVTIYRPGHHIRNMVGDVYLGWMDGVNSVRPYTLAARVQRSMQGVYKDMSEIDKMVQLGVASKGLSTPKPGQVLFKNRSGVPFTAEQIGAVAHQKGLLEHAQTLEDIIDMGATGARRNILDVKPFGGRVQAVARGASELQSHNARLAHFIDKVEKSHGKNLEDIFEKASQRARKWHPSGLDLTDFEKKYLRRIMPFYSWMRKSLPLLIEGLVMNPGKTVVPAKIFDAIQASQGIETSGRHDPFPVDQMFPEWIRSQGIGPIDMPEGFLSGITNQQPEGYSMAGMGLNPLTELITQLSSPGKTIASSITPAVKIPMELMMGREAFTQEPLTGMEARPEALSEYIGSQIPIASAVQSVTGFTPFGTETKRGSEGRMEAFINYLTGAGLKGTGPYIRQARYEFTAPARMQKKMNKEEFLEELRRRMEN